MSQGNPEIFPKGNSNFTKAVKNIAIAGGVTAGVVLGASLSDNHVTENPGTLLSDEAVHVSIDDINDLNLIFNDNDCGNAFFKEVCHILEGQGLDFIVSNQNDNLAYENATVITLDQQMIASEGVSFIGPCQSGTASHSEALLKSMQMTFHQRGWDTDSLAGVMQYQPSDDENVVYSAAPSVTENAVLPSSAHITISFGTMPDNFTINKVAEDIELSLARYQHYLENDSQNVITIADPVVPEVINDNHYFFNEQINAAPTFNSDLVIEVDREKNYSK